MGRQGRGWGPGQRTPPVATGGRGNLRWVGQPQREGVEEGFVSGWGFLDEGFDC